MTTPTVITIQYYYYLHSLQCTLCVFTGVCHRSS